MSVRIRAGSPEDAEALVGLLAEVNTLHAVLLPGVFRDAPGDGRLAAFLREWITRQGSVLLVAEGRDGPVGLALAVLGEAPSLPIFAPRRWVEVELLAVAEHARGHGVGRALMAAAEEWAAAQGAVDVRVVVWEANAGAVAFYERLGYVTARRTMWREPGPSGSAQ